MKKWNKRLLIFVFIALFFFLFIVFLNFRTKKLDVEKIEDSIMEENLLASLEEEKLEEEVPDIRKINILAAGDLMYHMPQVRASFNGGSYNFDNNFKHIKKYLERSDLSIVNYESIVAGGNSSYSGYPAFNSPLESLESIARVGFNIVNLNNNHSLDRGLEGLANTITSAKDLGLKNIGNGPEYILEDIDGIRLAILSYSYGYNGNEARYKADDLKKFINQIDEEQIMSDINKAKKEADFVILYLHWGQEYRTQISQEQKELAENIFKWGGDIILGSHPHVIQPARKIELDGEDKFVIYSMGNFISNQRHELMGTPYTEDGLMVDISLEKDMNSGNKKISQVNYIPTWTYKYYDDKYHYEIIPIKDGLNGELSSYRMENIEQKLKESYNRTEKILFEES